MPELLFQWDEMKNDARRRRKKEERSMETASVPMATSETQLNWQAPMSTAPMKRNRDDDDDDGEGGESGAEDEQAVSGKMGAAVYFNTADEMRGHSVAFHAEVREIKAMGVPELRQYIEEDIKLEKDPSWPVESNCKNSAVLDLAEWNATFYQIKITGKLLGKKNSSSSAALHTITAYLFIAVVFVVFGFGFVHISCLAVEFLSVLLHLCRTHVSRIVRRCQSRFFALLNGCEVPLQALGKLFCQDYSLVLLVFKFLVHNDFISVRVGSMSSCS